jgi:predicted nucleotidyltransferase
LWFQRAKDAIVALIPAYPGIRRAYLFGSIVAPGRFGEHSDIDVAVESETVEQESQFWQALERVLRRDVDVRPLKGAIADADRAQR